METAYFRELQHVNQCELVFDLKIVKEGGHVILQDRVRSVRQITDTVQSLLQHTRNKIIKMLENKENIELSISLTKAGCDINGSTSCLQLIKQFSKPISPKLSNNLIFKVCSQSFIVVVNAPLINTIGLPHILYVDHPLQATKFKAIFTEKHLCRNTWFTSTDKIVWNEVGRNYKYTPTINDLNKYIKLRCIPQNSKVDGPPYEVVSSVRVQVMSPIPKCPFEERHKYTSTKLTGSSLRVVSYNTLSDLYCDCAQFPYCSPETLSIDYRKQLIVKELEGYNADIICLQELDYYIFKQHLKGKLSKYKGIFHRKGNRLSEGLGCFYCKSRFRLLEVAHIVFSEQVRSNPLFKLIWKLLQVSRNLKDNILKQPTSLQLTILQSKEIQDIYIVANTHLYYHSEASDIRLIQASIALDYISSIVAQYKRNYYGSNVSVIFCGDFNSIPESPLFDFFTNGIISHTFEIESEMPLKDTCLKHPFKFASAYGTPKYTNYTDDFKGCLDYIFYEKSKLTLIECVPFPDESILLENTALPSKVFPSDHLALVADLKLV